MPVERAGGPLMAALSVKALVFHSTIFTPRLAAAISSSRWRADKDLRCAQKEIEPELDDNEHHQHHIIPSEPMVEEPRHVKAEVTARGSRLNC